MMVLQENPWHVNTLITQASIVSANGDHNAASDFIERAVFALEQSLPSHLSLAKAGRPWQLPYSVPENRALYLAFYAHLHCVLRRGAWRCALEVSKTLLKLDPTDPLRLDLLLPILALRAKLYDWILSFYDQSTSIDTHPGLVSLHRALAFAGRDQEENAVAEVTRVVTQYPSLYQTLASKVNVALTSTAEPTADPVRTFEENIYVERAYTLWKEPQVHSYVSLYSFPGKGRHDLQKNADVKEGTYSISHC